MITPLGDNLAAPELIAVHDKRTTASGAVATFKIQRSWGRQKRRSNQSPSIAFS